MAAFTAIDDAALFFNTVLYTGTGSSLGVTGAGFQPDFTWIKNRDTTDFHVLTDAVRGATKYLQSNSDSIEVTNAESLKSFDADGFTVGTQVDVNTNTEDFCSWNWKAGTTSGIATDGSTTITPSSYSFNQTSGVSILQYGGNSTSGAKLAHGLGVVPKMVFFKSTSHAGDAWAVYHASEGNTKYGTLDTNEAFATSSTRWNDTDPDSVNFTLGNSGAVNNSAKTYIAYCFADVQGYSKINVYTGNANADGPFIYTGFKPAYIMLKSTGLQGWFVFDSKRIGYNVANSAFEVDGVFAETSPSTYLLDILSNGFKPRHLSGAFNGSGTDYIYIAFADSPFANSNGVPSTSRLGI